MIRRMLLSMVLTASMLSLQACERAPAAWAVATAAPGSSETRRVEIVRQVRAICPTPMSATELEAAAAYLETHPDALRVIQRLDVFDRQSRICRGEAP